MRICDICGQPFAPATVGKRCSERCRKEHERRRSLANCRAGKGRKAPPESVHEPACLGYALDPAHVLTTAGGVVKARPEPGAVVYVGDFVRMRMAPDGTRYVRVAKGLKVHNADTSFREAKSLLDEAARHGGRGWEWD